MPSGILSPDLPLDRDFDIRPIDVLDRDGIVLSTSRAALWQGFSIAWRKDPHRLTHVASELSDFTDVNDGGQQAVRLRHRQALAVGDFPDQGDLMTHVTRVGGADLRFVHRSATARLAGPIGQALRFTGTEISVNLPFPSGTDVVVAAVLRGFSLDVVSRPDGYTARGFGAGLIDETLAGRTFRFRPTFFVRVDNNPDRPAQASGEDVVYDMTVHYTVIAAPRDRAAMTPTDPDPLSYNDETVGPPPVVHVADGDGGGQFPHAAFGVRRFEWELDEVHPLGLDGRYIRLIHNYVTTTSYDPASGRAACHVVRSFSNAGLAPLRFDCTHHVDLLLLQIADGSTPVSGVLYGAVGGSTSDVTGFATL